MKTISLIVIIAVVVSFFAPVHVATARHTGDTATKLFTLDVCHASGQFIPGGGDVPVIIDSPCTLCIIPFAGLHTNEASALKRFLIVFKTVDPPRD